LVRGVASRRRPAIVVLGTYKQERIALNREWVRKGAPEEDWFAGPAVGWILRDLSEHDRDGAREFVEKRLGCLPIEANRSAVKYHREVLRWEGTQEICADAQDWLTCLGGPRS